MKVIKPNTLAPLANTPKYCSVIIPRPKHTTKKSLALVEQYLSTPCTAIPPNQDFKVPDQPGYRVCGKNG